VCSSAQTHISESGILCWHGPHKDAQLKDKEISMLYTLGVILLVAWLFGITGIYAIGASVHVVLLVAIVLFAVGVLGSRRAPG
jgi:hypothetical protein